MNTSTENALLTHAPLTKGLWALELGLSLLITGYVFRGAVAFAAWTLEFLWS